MLELCIRSAKEVVENSSCVKKIIWRAAHSGLPDLFEHRKPVFSVRLSREVPTQSGSRFIRTSYQNDGGPLDDEFCDGGAGEGAE